MTDLKFAIANEPHRRIGSTRADSHEAPGAIADKALAQPQAVRPPDGAESARGLRSDAAALA